jgi:predicted transposase/invertase (TIGR01784 family)
MSFDNLCKLLAEKHPAKFAHWLIGVPIEAEIKILKTELTIEPIRADAVTFLQTRDRVFHIEFQTQWLSKPPMPFRMLDYWVRLYRQYELPIVQVVVVLLPPTDETTIQPFFRSGSTYHEFTVIKMWEQDPEIFLQDPDLLPFAALAQTADPEALLNRVAQQVAAIPQIDDRKDVSARVQLLAGLKYDKDIIKQLFWEDMMRESVIYQEILQEGEQRGKAIGKEEGKEENQREVALKMLQENFEIAVISRLTGLPIVQLQELQKQST